MPPPSSDLAGVDLAYQPLTFVEEMRIADINTQFSGVWGSSSADVYVVGNAQGRTPPALVYHSTGNGVWTAQTTPSVACGLGSVWGSSSSDIYAVGCQGVLLHSSGQGNWSQQTATGARDFYRVWGSSAGDVYAVDGGLWHSMGGGSWSQVTLPGGTAWSLLSGFSFGAADAYAVGGKPGAPGTYVAAILHLAGGTWTEVPANVPSGPSGLLDIWGTGDRDLYSVGHANNGGTVVLHQGSSFTLQPASGNGAGNVWGSGPNDVYVLVGDKVLHSNGFGTWAPIDLGVMTLTFGAIWGSGPRDIYVLTGSDGYGPTRILHGH
jgi:hypothetical protein